MGFERLLRVLAASRVLGVSLSTRGEFTAVERAGQARWPEPVPETGFVDGPADHALPSARPPVNRYER